MKSTLLLPVFLFTAICSYAQSGKSRIDVLVRCDDIGMCHAVNEAAKKVLDTGIPVSMSVMVPCPWFSEAVEMLKQYPNVSVGIHLTLNSEWKQYRWGPVTGAALVPSLVDSVGNFFPSRALLFAHDPKLSEIETELRAQIDKAIASGLRIDYLDHHMSAAVQTPETRKIVEKLAAEYQLGISRYYEEVGVEGWYFTPPADKQDSMLVKLQHLQAGHTNLLVLHVGLETAEMNALEDANPFGPKEMSKHRQGELNGLLAPSFQQLLHDPKYRLVNYRMLKEEKGISSLKRPEN